MAISKEIKRRKLKLVIIIAGSIIAFMVLTVGTLAIANQSLNKSATAVAQSFDRVVIEEQLVPYEDENGYWSFTTDNEFKVLQFTDVHLGGGVLSYKKDLMALNAIAAIVTYEKPDLVVVTGDIVYPTPIHAGTLNNLAPAKVFITLMEQLGVYWTFAFGNHDTESYSYYSREQIASYYESAELTYCLFKRGPSNVDGEGNQVINVRNSQNIITQTLILFDSHSYVDGISWGYDNIHSSQIEWYRSVIAGLNIENEQTIAALDPSDLPENAEELSTVKSLMFFHIPLAEYKDAWMEYVDNGYIDTDNAVYAYGFARESGKIVYAGVGEDDLFETVVELGSTKGIFCGHDHLNNFSIAYQGVRLTYGMSIDYLAYSNIHRKGAQRGATVIRIKPDTSFECSNENYYQDKYVAKYAKETVNMD